MDRAADKAGLRNLEAVIYLPGGWEVEREMAVPNDRGGMPWVMYDNIAARK